MWSGTYFGDCRRENETLTSIPWDEMTISPHEQVDCDEESVYSLPVPTDCSCTWLGVAKDTALCILHRCHKMQHSSITFDSFYNRVVWRGTPGKSAFNCSGALQVHEYNVQKKRKKKTTKHWYTVGKLNWGNYHCVPKETWPAEQKQASSAVRPWTRLAQG